MTCASIERPLGRAQLEAGDAFCNRWHGAPFLWNGGSRDEGVDCWGLVRAFAAEVFARELPDWHRADHSRHWVSRLMTAEALGHPRFDAPRDGCIVVARLGGLAHHVGIYWRGGVLHSAEPLGVSWQRLAEFAVLHPAYEFGELAL